jgi:hypothetical protein
MIFQNPRDARIKNLSKYLMTLEFIIGFDDRSDTQVGRDTFLYFGK